MIVRTWEARATPDNARAYVAYFHRVMRPRLSQLAGHRGAMVLTRADQVVIQITVITMWDSFEAISAFAPEVEKASIEPEAQGMFLSFDPLVRHHHLALDTRFERAKTSY